MEDKKIICIGELLDKYLGLCYETHNVKISDKYHSYIVAFAKELCEKTLELAAENAKVREVGAEHDDYIIHVINKQSILNTINQVE